MARPNAKRIMWRSGCYRNRATTMAGSIMRSTARAGMAEHAPTLASLPLGRTTSGGGPRLETQGISSDRGVRLEASSRSARLRSSRCASS